MKTSVCGNCQALADEVAALKRELAGRTVGRVFQVPNGTATFTTGAVGMACVHEGVYGVCRKLGCVPAKGKA